MSLFQRVPEFILTTFFLTLVPGQGMAMVLRQTLIGGRRIGIISVLGNGSGLVFWGLASSVGLAAAFAASPTAYTVLKYAGVAYLIFVAFQTLWTLRGETNAFDTSGANTNQSIYQAYRRGLITNLTNAKAGVFAVAFLPLFVPDNFDVGPGVAFFGVLWAVVSCSTYSMIIVAFDKAASKFASPQSQRRLTVISGLGILLLAATLAFS